MSELKDKTDAHVNNKVATLLGWTTIEGCYSAPFRKGLFGTNPAGHRGAVPDFCNDLNEAWNLFDGVGKSPILTLSSNQISSNAVVNFESDVPHGRREWRTTANRPARALTETYVTYKEDRG